MAETSKKDFDHLFKVPIVGESDVGKTSMLLRFVEDTFSDQTQTSIGVDYKLKVIEINKLKIKLQIWDTAGQERFRTVTSSFYRGCKGIMLVIDLTDPDALRKATHWQKDIQRNTAETTPVFIIGNKKDLESLRKISHDEAQDFATSNKMRYIETSAKTGDNVTKAFEELTKDMLGPAAGHRKSSAKSKREGGGSSGGGTCTLL